MPAPCRYVVSIMHSTDELTGVEQFRVRHTRLYPDGRYHMTDQLGRTILDDHDPAVYSALIVLTTLTPGDGADPPGANPGPGAAPTARTAPAGSPLGLGSAQPVVVKQ